MADESLGRFHFQAWVRRGLALAIANPDNPAAPAPSRHTLAVDVTVQAVKGGNVSITDHAQTNAMPFGPGDVIGIDPRHIIRTEPRHLTANFEPNYLAGIEFDQPDFPWLFTPAAPNGDRLRPWLSLIVLKPDEFDFSKDPPHPLQKITVKVLGALPDISRSWAWAHGQVVGDLPANGIAGILATAPGNATSRLLCPRRLEPDTRYFTFLVPAFEPGRLVGIGLDASSSPTAMPAWPPAGAATTIDLPVYFTFEFHTSDRGDFESLVRQLVPRALPATVGIRAMDVSHPAPPPFPNAGPPLGLGGALRSPQTADTEWREPDKSNFETALGSLINQTSPVNDDPDKPNPADPKVVPPIYGQWAAGITGVNSGTTRWIDRLNLDPRNRVAAGIGRQVVEADRNALLASAWRQIEGVERANQILRQAQMARAAMVMAFERHFKAGSDESFLSLIQPVHTKLLASPKTITATLSSTRLPIRAFSGAFRRATRPQGPLRRRQGATASPPALLAAKLNEASIGLTPPIADPAGMVSIDQIADNLFPTWIPRRLRAIVAKLRLLFFLLLLALVVVAALGLILAITTIVVGVAVAVALAAATAALAVAILRSSPAIVASETARFGTLFPDRMRSVPPRPNFGVVAPGNPFPPHGGQSGPADDLASARFRSATIRLSARLQAPPRDPASPPAADLSSLRIVAQTNLDPTLTVPKHVMSVVQIDPRLGWPLSDGLADRQTPADPIAPIMAYPVFDRPMYESVRDLSQQYLLPGLDLIPPDTLSLVLTHHAFVEGYMVGLNHEMARQLLWVGYPTDLRGSPFRQFWDIRSYVPQPGDPTDPAALAEELRDIKPVHTWPLGNQLGDNRNRPQMVPENLVLLVRGELLRRYPNAIIYAAKATWNPEQQRRELGPAEKHPLFRGTLDPDITFFGFDLTVDAARGQDPTKGGDPGWFFVFKQHPTEPRFGLEPMAKDPVTTYAELAWSDFPLQPPVAGGPVFLSPDVGPQNLAIAAGSPDLANNWGLDAAQTAYILYRHPARIAVHASLMLPRRGASG